MPNPNIAQAGKNTRWKPGQSGNPDGNDPGYKHITTWVQKLLHDDKFVAMVKEASTRGQRERPLVQYKGAPVEGIIRAQLILALGGDTNAFEALVKAGYGQKFEVDGNLEGTITVITRNAAHEHNADAAIEAEVVKDTPELPPADTPEVLEPIEEIEVLEPQVEIITSRNDHTAAA